MHEVNCPFQNARAFVYQDVMTWCKKDSCVNPKLRKAWSTGFSDSEGFLYVFQNQEVYSFNQYVAE